MKISVVIPTLAADEALEACLDSLRAQSFRDYEVIVIDNSGKGAAARLASSGVQVIVNSENTGYGAAINLGIRSSDSLLILALNDDTVLHPDCLEKLAQAAAARREAGMYAPQIRIQQTGKIDSTGMLIAPDGTSRQRAHGSDPAEVSRPTEALLPSGCAALYKREMLDEIGLFDESYFLYCEDTDLGLRARWKAWECLYVPGAVVEHRYSHSAGAASALKAYYVERNRLRTAVKNLPLRNLLLSPLHSVERYWWHWRLMNQGQGKAAEYAGNESLAGIALRAWWHALRDLPRLWKQRREIQKHTRLTSKQYARLLLHYRISSRQVAGL